MAGHALSPDPEHAPDAGSPAQVARWRVLAEADPATTDPEAARRRALDAEWAALDRAKAFEAQQRARGDGWAHAVSEALDDRQLAVAVARLTRPLPVIERRSVPAVRADLVLWASALHEGCPDRPLPEVLGAALQERLSPADVPETDEPLPPPPPLPAGVEVVELSDRIEGLLAREPGREPAAPDVGLSL